MERSGLNCQAKAARRGLWEDNCPRCAVGVAEEMNPNSLGADHRGGVIERTNPDARDALGDRNARQARATIERMPPNAGDTMGDHNARQARATIERMPPNACNA